MHRLIFSIVFTAFLMFFLAAPQLSFADELYRTISVVGEHTQKYAPNELTLDFQIVNKNKDLKEAEKQNREGILAMQTAMTELAIKNENLRSTRVNIYPSYKPCKRTDGSYCQSTEIDFYTVNRSFSLKLNDFDIYENLMIKLMNISGITINGISFWHSEIEKLQNEIRVIALQNARNKAENLLKALDEDLGKVISITENSGYGSLYPLQKRFNVNEMRGLAAADSGFAQTQTLEPGEIEVKANINAVFAIK